MEEIVGGIVKEYLDLKLSAIKRDLEIEWIEGKAISVIGGRRVGKTYYLFYHFQKLREEGKNVVFFSFDDDRIYPPRLETLQTVIKVSKKIYPEGKIYYFFDEIQELSNWELAVKRLIERENSFVVVTGSSSKLLSKEIATQLRGRTVSHELFPLSFKEVVRCDKKVDSLTYLSEKEVSKIKGLLENYVLRGGYPEIAINKLDARKVLAEYFDVMIFRDIVERWNIKNYKAVKLFLTLAISNFSSKFSINRLSNYMKTLGIRISKNSLYNYLEYANDAYILFPVKKFLHSPKEMEQSVPKIYVIDNGLINVVSYTYSRNLGRLMENLVFLELRRKYKENKEIFYFQTKEGYEVDFLIKEGLKIKQMIQVTYANSFDEIDPREWRALIKAHDLLKAHKPELIIITWDYEDEKEISWFNKRAKIKFIPLWKWLLSNL